MTKETSSEAKARNVKNKQAMSELRSNETSEARSTRNAKNKQAMFESMNP